VKLDIVQLFKQALFNLAITSSLPSITIISLTPGPCCKEEEYINNKSYFKINSNNLIINLLAFNPLIMLRSIFIKLLYTILFDFEKSFNTVPKLSIVKSSMFIK